MKVILGFFILLFLAPSDPGQKKIFIGSTPAHPVVKTFLGIPVTDSIDFIRWKLVLQDGTYQVYCNYGIGKPNTNGFINGGRKIEWKGSFSRQKNNYQLVYGNRKLSLVELNNDLLHLLDHENRLLVGNGGWSYTLNNVSAVHSSLVNLTTKPAVIKDSIAFEGRTPCGVPGIIPAGKNCYKLKWYFVLYPDAGKNGQGRYRLLGTAWRAEGGLRGRWNLVDNKDGRVIYQLHDEKGKAFIHLLKLDDHVLIFTDAEGKLLVGDEDFSYTVNRRR